ncbi:fructosamine-3-kinase [Pseudozyma hubeiensis SY62]|uniref:protein-ribulosamine 3-kinase n=1 Tax=Pseudozyma hubeiensis (strain SY62) TaxID=1305764 RepID=R9NYV0_PSEHS|nr:fructosamine-3-kinase [Pseudozyma hubeiensis SY62]GAC93871.1 fructosamine-3-kinase [Pseudozyma hubeiensis SY62]
MALDKTLESILRGECSHLGSQFISRGASCVAAQPSGRKLFAKIDDAVEQTLGEAESLKAMGSALSSDDDGGAEVRLTPEVHASGKAADGRAYLITDYLELKSSINKAGQKRLGSRLAEMHKKGINQEGRFGFGVATYCGVTRQDNSWNISWPKFWADQRIGDLVRRINAEQNDAELKDLEEQMRSKCVHNLTPSSDDNATR